MISLVVAAVLLLIHALVCLMLWTLMKLGLLPVRGHMLAVIVLVPLWELLKERLPEDLAAVPERLADLQADVHGVRWYTPFPLPQARRK